LQRVETPARRRVWWNEYIALFLVVWMVGTVVWAVGHAGWNPLLTRLPIVAVPGLILGYIAAKTWRAPAAALHGAALLGGALLCWLVAITAPGAGAGSLRHRSVLLWHRGIGWGRAIWRGEATEDRVLFLLATGLLVFALAYAVMWWTFRTGASALAIGVPGAALFVTIGAAGLSGRWYLAAYLLAALPLAARFAGFRQEARWQRAWIAYPTSIRSRYLSVGSGIAVALVLLTSLLPLSVHIAAINTAWDRAQQPAQQLVTDFQDRFARAVNGNGGPTIIPGFASFGPTFRLAGSLNLSDAPAVLLTAQESHYLSANSYDFYNGLGWEDRATATFNPQGPNGAVYSPQVSVGAKQPVPHPAGGTEATTTVNCDAQFLRPRGTLLYACGQAETVSVDARVSLSWQQLGQSGTPLPVPTTANLPAPLTTLVRLVSNLEALTLPGDVPTPGANGEATVVRPDGTLVISLSPARAQTWNPKTDDLAGYVQHAMQGQPQGASAKPISRIMVVPPLANTTTVGTPPNAVATATASADPRFASIEAEQDRLRKQLIDTQIVVQGGKVTTLLYRGQTPNFADVTTLDAGAPINANDSIAMTARVSTATAEQLRSAATSYPQWLDRYRTLPNGSTPNSIATSQRVRDLAAQLARGQRDPYDIAAAIERYLRSPAFTYATVVNNPPTNRDVTDYFLFDGKEGYCEYFATAMAVLLRADSIPARIVAGYLPGARQADGRFLSRESQAHSWVEVYFPQYGWVTFDPTPRPDVAPITRGAGNTAPEPTPAPAPAPAPAAEPPASNPNTATQEPGAAAAAKTHGGFHVSPLVLLIPFTLLALWGLCAWYWFLPFRGLAPAAQWYARLQRSARWIGVPNARAATPFETAEAVGERLPEGKPAAMTIAARYAEEQYAGRPPASADVTGMRGAWKVLLTSILRALPHRLARGTRKKRL